MSGPEIRAKLTLEATISPSEDPVKVVQAMKNVVGGAPCEFKTDPHSARLTTDDPTALVRIKDQLRDRHVRSAARRQMLLSRSERAASLMLNRQAAATGVIALCGSPEESPLGPIYLVLESDKIDALVDWLTA